MSIKKNMIFESARLTDRSPVHLKIKKNHSENIEKKNTAKNNKRHKNFEKKLKNNIDKIDRWYRSPMGQPAFNALESYLATVGRQLPGRLAIQLGAPSFDWINAVSCQKKIQAEFVTKNNISDASIVDENHEAVAADAADVIVCVHLADLQRQPVSLLQSCERLLAPGGSLILIGFNPWGFLGLRRLMGDSCELPWSLCWRSMSQWRSICRSLTFQTKQCKSANYIWPTHSLRWQQRCEWMQCWGNKLLPQCGQLLLMQFSKPTLGAQGLGVNWKIPTSVVGQVINPRT